MSDFALRLSGVTKRFGSHTAVDHLDLEVPRGSIYGLLGPNGSGKTTSIRMIMGILLPDEGRVELFGSDPDETRRRRVGYLPEERGLYRKMKVLDLLAFMGEIRGVAPTEGRRRAGDWLDRLGLQDWIDRKVEDLSKGMQQKVQFVATVLHQPELLILDEPFSGLDPINQDVLEEIVREFHRKGTTILFSTHLMDQAERLCERVCLISRARKVLDGDLKGLKRAESRGVLAVGFEGSEGWLEGPEVMAREAVGGDYHLVLADGADPQAILRRAIAAEVTIRRFELVEPRLHEIFVHHAGEAAAGDGGMPRALDGTGGVG
ncbi:MAG: ATP-binding cassette domain-containing protein [Gemmatimonadales bacterium]|jgi:ABC-2 type transport system ATP-binding protein|nr:MAG: ATP-binding cassette domain-containing protein [Gemmatimonadales bacterium]